MPVLTVTDAYEARTAVATTLRFTVTLSRSSASVASVSYSLSDGTAISPRDYAASTGTITIPANQTQAVLEVQVKGDPTDLRQNNLFFNLQLSNPQNCSLGSTSAKGFIVADNGTNLPTNNAGYTTPATYPGYTPVWADEFSGSTIDLTAWNQEIGNGASGWGNNELQYYTNSTKNCFVSNGNLVIEARKETIAPFNYTSARMTTQHKKNFRFGRIDIRAKLPVGKGIWPALWMLGENITSVGWPACGEIDIMELVGTNPSRVHGTMHWKALNGSGINKGGSYDLAGGDYSQQFHVFSIVWTQNMIKWYVDDVLFFTGTSADMAGANYPFNANHFLIFNVAVGGNWPGPPDAGTVFPQRMFVDYVRVFQ
jgi:beta-glucanase (GH16 family)